MPTIPWRCSAWAELHTWRKTGGKTKDCFGKILEKYESNSNAHYYQGIAYRESGKYKALLLRKLDWDKARNHFKAIIERDSLFSDVLYQYAILLRYREKYTQALAMAHRQIRLKPELTTPQVKIFRMVRYFITHRNEKEVHEWGGKTGNGSCTLRSWGSMAPPG